MNRFFISLILVLVYTFSTAQDDPSDLVNTLNKEIENSSNGKKLQLMDSLTRLIEFNEEFHYEKRMNEQIAFALSIDSINNAIHKVNDLIFYKNIVLGYPNEGLGFYEKYRNNISNTTDLIANSNFYMYTADCYTSLGQYKKALKLLDTAKTFADQSNNSNRKATILSRNVTVFTELGMFTEASLKAQETIRLFIEEKDTLNIIRSKSQLSVLYSQNAFYKEAEAERNEAIKLSNAKSSNVLTPIYYNAAADYRLMGDFKKWIQYLKLTLKTNEVSSYGEAMKPNILSNFVIAYAASDSLSIAETYLKDLEKLITEETRNETYYIEALKSFHFYKEDYTKALEYGKQHLNLKRSEESFVEIYNAEKFLADTYLKLGNERKANIHLNTYYKIKDSISNVQKVKVLTHYQTLYETEKRDRVITSQKSDIQLLDTQHKVKNQWIVIGTIILLSIFGVFWTIRSQKFHKRKQILQEHFSRGLIQTQEEERNRVARELHDGVGQKLMLLTKKSKALNNDEIEGLAENTLGELRSIARGLYPAAIEKLGVTAAIESMIDEVDENTKIFFTHDIYKVDKLLDKEESLHLFRIIQESLNNIVKHAEAKAASVVIEKDGNLLKMKIKDNGKGFMMLDADESFSSMGMKTLQERAKILDGELAVNSKLKEGTTVILKMSI